MKYCFRGHAAILTTTYVNYHPCIIIIIPPFMPRAAWIQGPMMVQMPIANHDYHVLGSGCCPGALKPPLAVWTGMPRPTEPRQNPMPNGSAVANRIGDEMVPAL